MTKNVRRQIAGPVFDRVGRIIDGLIENGRLILMIALFVSMAFMVRSFSDLAATQTQDETVNVAPTIVKEIPASIAADEPVERIEQRSEYRIRMHYNCAQSEFRAQNKERCERLNEDVSEAVENHAQSDSRKRDTIEDGETKLEPAAVYAASATRES